MNDEKSVSHAIQCGFAIFSREIQYTIPYHTFGWPNAESKQISAHKPRFVTIVAVGRDACIAQNNWNCYQLPRRRRTTGDNRFTWKHCCKYGRRRQLDTCFDGLNRWASTEKLQSTQFPFGENVFFLLRVCPYLFRFVPLFYVSTYFVHLINWIRHDASALNQFPRETCVSTAPRKSCETTTRSSYA